MNREIKYEFEVEKHRDLTKAEAIEKDKAEPWRKRISSGAMEDINALSVLILWANNIAENPKNQKLMRETGVYSRIKSSIGLLQSAINILMSQISAVQLRTMDANWQTMNITLSATKALDGFVNVDTAVLETLIKQTMIACKEQFCMKDEKESRSCAVRNALDECINAGRFANNHDSYDGLCPYCLRNLTIDED